MTSGSTEIVHCDWLLEQRRCKDISYYEKPFRIIAQDMSSYRKLCNVTWYHFNCEFSTIACFSTTITQYFMVFDINTIKNVTKKCISWVLEFVLQPITHALEIIHENIK